MPIALGLKALYISIAIVLAGNGLQNIYLTVLAKQSGFSLPAIGLMGSSYFLGFILGCIYGPRYLNSVGHIRTFSALAAIGATIALLHGFFINPVVWVILKGLTGFCFATLYVVIESWVNSFTTNVSRGQVISKYRMADFIGVLSGQFLFLLIDEIGIKLLTIYSILIMISIVPISLTKVFTPNNLEVNKTSLIKVFKRTWKMAPVSIFGVVLGGFVSGSFWSLVPIYALDVFQDIKKLPFVMATYFMGGVIMQYPMGIWSDRIDRRKIILLVSCLAVSASLIITLYSVSKAPELIFWLGIFMFGVGSLPIYSLAIAHANDVSQENAMISLSSMLLIANSIGSICGPYLAAFYIQKFGSAYLFLFLSFGHIMLALLTLWRIGLYEAIPKSYKFPFVLLPRITPMITKMDRRRRSARATNTEGRGE